MPVKKVNLMSFNSLECHAIATVSACLLAFFNCGNENKNILS
ncbi:hypothetical protein BH11BAC5_BH11BAC5_48670 [soil metagenome]